MSLTIDVHHHILPDFFWRATNEQHGPVGQLGWLYEFLPSSSQRFARRATDIRPYRYT
jgi:hypothetical protein